MTKNFLMPLDWKALMTDPKVIAMPDNVAWGFMRLLAAAWDAVPCGTLPNDDITLASLANLESPGGTSKLQYFLVEKVRILAPFRLSARDNKWHQKKMKKVALEVRKSRKVNKAKALHAAKTRWNKHAPSIAPSIAPSMLSKVSTPPLERARVGSFGSRVHAIGLPELAEWITACHKLGVDDAFAEDKWYAVAQFRGKKSAIDSEIYLERVLFWWRNEGASWVTARSRPLVEKNGVSARGSGGGVWATTQAIKVLDELINEHPACSSNLTGMKTPSESEAEELRDLYVRRKALKTQLEPDKANLES